MAVRKKSNAPKEKEVTKNGLVSRFAGRIKRVFIPLLCFLLGGIVFNLDRSGELGITLLKYRNYIPSPFSRFLPGSNAREGAAVPDQIISGKVIEAYDGDTITVFQEAANSKFKVRFFGVDAPEAAQQYGTVSRDALREKILGKNVTVKVVSIDRYGRCVGRVMLGARYINLEMVSEGHAWYYPDYARNEYDLASGEREAKINKYGLWQYKSPQPPWEYRQNNK